MCHLGEKSMELLMIHRKKTKTCFGPGRLSRPRVSELFIVLASEVQTSE
jgi:hypothetical protein